MKPIGKLKILALVLVALVLVQCSGKKSNDLFEVKFNPHISAFTAGAISSTSTLTIVLSDDYKGNISLVDPIPEKLFDFSPTIKGLAFWVDKRTIEFRPEQRLPNGQTYHGKFFLNKIKKVDKEHGAFEFRFQTRKQSFSVSLDGFEPHDPSDGVFNKVSGTLTATDIIDQQDVAKILVAKHEGQPLKIRWDSGASATSHTFFIDSVKRTDNRTNLLVSWNAKPIGLDHQDEVKKKIPAIGDFEIMAINVRTHPEQHVSIRFSDPLRLDQNLNGLIRIDNINNLRFLVQGTEVRIFLDSRFVGKTVLRVDGSVRSHRGFRIGEELARVIVFEDLKPAVRLVGRGVIIPNTDGLVFPFEAVNLSAVEVRVIKIFENNVAQFLQVNSLDGSNQMRRAGRLVLLRTIQLTSQRNLDHGKWNTFSFDLSRLVEPDPGSIYRIEIGFRREHSLYKCGDSANEATVAKMTNRDKEMFELELAKYDTPDHGYYFDDNDYYYDEDEGSSYWENRDNPCSNHFYGSRRSVSRNVLASNLGIVAKAGSDGEMTLVVTDLRTAKPLSGVSIELLNYQNQVVATARTGSQGMVRVTPQGKPFLLVARQDNQRGYLRLDDGSSLSMSRFDVLGNVIQRGLKGFLYGERGVWRPGDSIFITFVLEDRQKVLPDRHPVIFEFFNPLGQLVQRLTRTESSNGFYNFSTATAPDAPTGNWSGRVTVGGTTFSRVFMIETVKPNRLKIDLDFGPGVLMGSQKESTGRLKANWLHGAIARNLKTNVAVTLKQTTTAFDNYNGFVFDDPTKRFESDEVIIFDGRLNDQGEARVAHKISVKDAAPGMLMAGFVTRVFEEGGDFSIDRFTKQYSPYSSYVGLKVPRGFAISGMLANGTDHTIELATVDANGRPISKKNLQVEIFKVQWTWWWDASSENLASYSGNTHHRPIKSMKVSTANGKGSFKFNIPHPDWGRFLIKVTDPEGGHSTGKTVYVDWPGWGSRAAAADPQAASMLSFSANKSTFNVGDQVMLSIPTPAEGRILVSIESGSKVLDAYWIEATGNQTELAFNATPQMTPNVYVNVTLVQPHGQTANDLPIRMYGVIPIFVEDPTTRLSPVIEMANTLGPEEKATIKIKEKSGKPMTYTLAIVDEGLLDLTRFATPDPWKSFYAREALGVKTWDMYDYVLGAFGGRIESMFSLGGDTELNPASGSQANRFKPMVRFLGPFNLDNRKTATHTFVMPQYVGSVRVMAIAGNQGAYGHAQKTVSVKKPLMVLATLPRVLTPGETVKLPVTVFAMESNIRNVRVEVQTNQLLPVVGSKAQQVSFDQVGDKVVNFDLDVANGIGVGKLKVIVTSGSERAEQDIEIDVRNPNQVVSDFIETVIEPGKEWRTDYTPVGMAGTNTGILEVSSIPPVDFGRRLKYLIDYPHGCLEQVVSAAFPQLFLGTVLEMDANMQNITQNNIREAIAMLGRYQRPDGGLAYWPGGAYSNDWAISYAGHFFLEAEARGYNIPSGLKTSWLRYQQNAARNFKITTRDQRFGAWAQLDLVQAYRLYTLALAQSPEMGAMNRLRENQNLSVQARWRLAAAYAIAGQPEAAANLVDGITKTIAAYTPFNNSFGSAERDAAMIIETLVLLKRRNEAIPMVQELSKALTSKRWLSTQSTAYALLAISKFVGDQKVGDELKYTYSINDASEQRRISKQPINQIPIEITGASAGRVVVKNTGNTVVFARILLSGRPQVGEMTESQNNLNVGVAYRNMQGGAIEVSRLQQGTDFIAEVTLRNPGLIDNYTDMVLSQVFPSGWEIHNVRMDLVASAQQSSVPTYQDIRDDRVHTFFDLNSNQTKKFVVRLNAAYRGRFFLPGVFAQAMYNDRVSARLPGQWVEVVGD